jgi:hypothetical protein
MMDLIQWNREKTVGHASLDAVRRLYRSGAVRAADGKPLAVEPERGHVHTFSTETEPVMIGAVHRQAGIVVFVPLSLVELAKAVHAGRYEVLG